jgi:XrtN system VIT domain protein
MKHKLEFLNPYIQKLGVIVSINVTLLNLVLFIISFLYKKLEYYSFGYIIVLNLIVVFIFGVTVSFLVLRRREKYLHLIPFLILNWFIGCFSLNLSIPIFEDLPVWTYLVTLVFCISNFSIYQEVTIKNSIIPIYFINGISYTLILYYAFYLLPFTPFAIIAIIVLGLGFYALVPIIVLIIHTITIARLLQETRVYFLSFFAGFSIIVISLLVFSFCLNLESRKINQITISKSFNHNEDLPNYIVVSQNLKPNFLNEILLKKDLVYIPLHDIFSFRGLDSFGSKQFNERKNHNPFISIAYLFCEDLDLSKDDRINILKSNFDKRLETEEQLWSGEDVFTKTIKEDVKLYPEARLAYTEITMNIACAEKSWRDQEAIYSFQLPEGSVATSLSLWINGVERKGVLTTKEKALKAYKQIVGVEYRDPSLMQWKEGNKVVVRVFPVNRSNPRTFKCGFTTPLKVEDQTMKYQSLSIKGPNISNAKTISRIQTVGNTKIETTKNFELSGNYYLNQSEGLDDWEASMPLIKTKSSSSFAWKEKVYEVREIQKTAIPFTPSEIILDLTSNWTTKQIESFATLNSKDIYVYLNGIKTNINKDNYRAIELDFENLQYSLLPLSQITKNSLIITKCNTFSANFEDLTDSEYLKKLKTKVKDRNLKVINISEEVNPFWQTAKEQKYVEYYQTSVTNALKLIKQHQFILFKTEKNVVNIEPANIAIVENSKTNISKTTGPNHIYRMYAFGKVLEEQVKIQNDSLANNQYVELAKDANIVTPISSLIVLETDNDYKKQGIEKNVNTLGNASTNNDGAVPEPHEWLLIIIGFTTLLFYYRKTKKQTI